MRYRLYALSLIFFCLINTQTTLACFYDPPPQPEIWVTGDINASNCYDLPMTVTMHDYTTFAASGDYCACALKLPLNFGTVVSAEIVYAGTQIPLSAFNFFPSPPTVFDPTPDWNGFLAAVDTAVESVSVDLRFQIIMKTDDTCSNALDQLKNYWETQGVIAGTGGSDPSGIPGHHVHLTTDADINFTNVDTMFSLTCIPAPAGLAAWWPLDEVHANSTPDIEGCNKGAVVGTKLIPGFVGKALAFNGSTDYVEIADAANLNVGTGDFSLDVWVRTTDHTGVKVIQDKRQTEGAAGYHLYLYNGEPGFQMADTNFQNFNSTTSVADGNWHLVAVTVERNVPGGGGKIYVDGVNVLDFDASKFPGNLDNNQPLRIGARSGTTATGFFQGDLDEFELFNRALTPAGIVDLNFARQGGKCKPERSTKDLRLFTHVTSSGGGFKTTLILSNLTSSNANYSLQPYDKVGNPLTPVSGTLAPGSTSYSGSLTLFNGEPVSHFTITGDIYVAGNYLANSGGSPAHVGETNLIAYGWRLWPGDWNLVIDGLAIVNLGACNADDLVIFQLDSNGQVLAQAPIPTMLPYSKSLILLDSLFTPVPNAIFEIRGSNELSLMALRFNKPAFDLFWQNLAIPLP